MSDLALSVAQPARARAPSVWANLDPWLLGATIALLCLGLIMVASASVSIAERHFGDEFFYLKRQAVALALALPVALPLLWIRLERWGQAGPYLLALAYLLLIAVLLPGVGREVNGAVRWIPMGVFNLQVSEAAKLLVFFYLAGYLVRRAEAVRTSMTAFAVPMAVMLAAALLLLAEPDFGASVVLLATGMGLLFLAGVPLWRFGALLMLCLGAAAVLIRTSPYRWERLTGFMRPWDDPWDSGFQLTQSLIAIGRGEWFGVGLGNSVQKLFYLPEAHTDFVFAVTAEELGLVGVLALVALYGFIVWRAFMIGARSLKAGLGVGGYIAYAIGLWLGMQAFVNMGVNMGLLPTKGLTLPLMSYGGSSLIMTIAALAVLLRADYELRTATVAASPRRRAGA